MARFVFAMNQSLDGYVDHMAFGPSPRLFAHFIAQTRGLAGGIYGRRLYEVMRYWDDDRAEWDTAQREFAAAWRAQPKWVVSQHLAAVGPNAVLLGADLAAELRSLKAERSGEIEIGGPNLARSLDAMGLIDAYQIYLHPVVLGGGTPFFAEPRPRLRLAASERMDEDVIRLTYVPA